jgi:antitoxin VapB
MTKKPWATQTHWPKFAMQQTAKVFNVGADQAVCLPHGFKFEAQEVFICKDAATGDVILSYRPSDWIGFLNAVKDIDSSEGFLSLNERQE